MSNLPIPGEIWYEEHQAAASCEILAVHNYSGSIRVEIRNSLGKVVNRRLGKTLSGKLALRPLSHTSTCSPIYIRECDLEKPLAVLREESAERGRAWAASLAK
jgi:hypothetical protein